MMMNIFGFLLVNWVNYGLSFAGGGLAWRLPLGLQFIFIFVLYATVPWLPESPRYVLYALLFLLYKRYELIMSRWLLAHGREEEAAQILADIENKDVSDPLVVAERREIVYSVEYERQNAPKWRDILLGRAGHGTKTLRRLVLGAGTQALQQFGGINVISYYMPTLLIESVGLGDRMSRLIAALAAIPYLIASGVAAPLVERFGRRAMMLVSTAIQLLCFLMLTVLIYFVQKPDYEQSDTIAKASVVFFFLYYIGFGLGMLGM